MNKYILIIILLIISNNAKSIDLRRNNELHFFEMTSILPNNYVKDGSVDYTKYLQKGLDEYRHVKMPDFPILINENGLKLKSDSHIFFQKNSKLITKSNSLEFFATIWLLDIKNVIIDNLVLVGDRDNHRGNKGEWGMGIYIDKSQNVLINNSNISNCWGDGIYIGGGSKPSSKIYINKANIINNRRNGITISNGENIEIKDSNISFSNGIMPMAGLCIEPNNTKNTVDKISIHNLNTNNNTNYGIVINLNKLLSNEFKMVRIAINNHYDNSSKTGLSIVDLFDDKKGLRGSINISNSKWNNNSIPSRLGKFKNGPNITLNNIQVFKDGILDSLRTNRTIDLYKVNGKVSTKSN